MKVKKRDISVLLVMMMALVISGCGEKSGDAGMSSAKGSVQTVVGVAEGEPLVYLVVEGAEASSFDQTPDWAPEPDPMAPVDGDMITRWSSDYNSDDQWISFDLGKESVVNNVIVRWERACASEYKILVSSDGKKWQEVYYEKNGHPGMVESVFSPIKCRYVKIEGVKRANEDWGISMWEVEIYGPASHNPGAKTTKEEYLSKGDEAAKKEEAKELLSENASAVVPFSEKVFQKGVVYTSWMSDELELPVSDITLVELKNTGYDSVAIMVPAYQDKIDSTEIFINDTADGDTPTIASLEHAVKTCHTLGLRVMIKPHVDPRTDEARINIMPSEEWFDSYEKFIVKYAEFSQKNGVELFSVGTELEATTFDAWAHRWDRVIDKIKEVYKGDLVYSANWTEYKEVPFWSRMDFIGIDAYFPIASSDEPTVEELKAAWNTIADDIEKWYTEKGLETCKGVILTEIGYPSADGSARQPWVAISNKEDQQEQADCFEAMFDVLTQRSWFKGYYVWQYFPQDRWSPLGFTIKGKTAGEVISKWLGKE
ncbi:MAG: discoidin domain-containing protein [Candidatus Omnitrophica bacterium]|nr:discoidin domain-containing protein [Candidatus Omnitrophota bacterium]